MMRASEDLAPKRLSMKLDGTVIARASALERGGDALAAKDEESAEGDESDAHSNRR